MDHSPLLPTNDFVFKKVFGEHLDILAAFLRTVLVLPDVDYQDMVVISPFLNAKNIGEKYAILDIKIKTGGGKTIDVEIQVATQPVFFKRMLYYNCKMFVEQLQSGHKYERLTRAISIVITDFILIKENDAYHNCFRLFDEKTGARYPDSLEINTLEIPKVRKEDGTQLNNWLKFFAAKTEEEFMAIAEKSPAIDKAWGVIKELSADEEARLIAESREKARMDYEDRMDGAVREGRQEGRVEIARNLLQMRMPVETIAKATGLSIAEIERLAAES